MGIGHPIRKDQISKGNSPRYSSQVEERFSPLANYIITQIFYRFKFPQHPKRQVRTNALSYFLLFFLTGRGSVLLVDTVNLALNEFAQGLIIEFDFFLGGRIG